MKPAANLKVDIAHSGFVSPVEAMQGDGGLRSISVELTDGGKPWYPPAGTEIAVAYTHSNGAKGLYSKLSDGRKAVTVRNNIVTVVLAPQMLAAAGEVKAAIVFNSEKLDQLTTFPITITVKKNLFADAQETVDYIRLQWLEDKLDEYLKKAKDSGVFDGPKGDAFTYADFTPEQLAALTGPQGPAGDNTAALEAAQAANTASQTAFNAAAAAQTVVDTIMPDITKLKTELASIAASAIATKRVLEALFLLNEGISYQYSSDDATAYRKTTAKGTKLARVRTIGGASIADNGVLLSVPVNEVVVCGQNLFDKSTAIQNKYITPSGGIGLREKTYLSDYISCRDFTDVSINKGGGIVWYGDDGSVLGFVGGKSTSIFRTYTKPSGAVQFRFDIPDQLLDDFSTVMCVAGVYTAQTIPSFTPYKKPTTYTIPAAVISLDGYGVGDDTVYNYVDFEHKQFVKQCEIVDGAVVALEEAVVTDISDLIGNTFEDPLTVEPGDNLSFRNAIGDNYCVAVPSNVEYVISLAEGNP